MKYRGFSCFYAGALFTGDLAGFEDAMLTQLDHWGTNAGRRALMVTSENDKACTGWARIPSGAKTCAFWVIRHLVDTVRVKGQFTEGHLNGHGWLTGGTEFPATVDEVSVFNMLLHSLREIDLQSLKIGANVILVNLDGKTYKTIISTSANNVAKITTFYPTGT